MAEVRVGGQWLRLLGVVVGDLSWSTRWQVEGPSGCFEASWTADLPTNATLPFLRPGALVEVFDGPTRVWVGQMDEPERGEPWSFHAAGLAWSGADYLALDALGAQTTKPSTAVTEAIVRGMPWEGVVGSLSAADLVAGESDLTRLDALLTAYSRGEGKRWTVWADGWLRLEDAPTTPAWALSSAGLMGTADEEFASHVYARYVSAVDGATGEPTDYEVVTAPNEDAAARWRRREEALDLTPLGLMISAKASGYAARKVDEAAPRLGFTSPLVGGVDDLTAINGVPARLSSVRAGQMVRVYGVLDSAGNLSVGSSADVVLGEVRYTDGEATVQMQPVGMVARSLSDVLAVAVRERPDAASAFASLR